MASANHATPARIYLTPTSAASGGTLIAAVDMNEIVFDPGYEASTRMVSLGANSGFRVRHRRVRPARFYIPLRDQSTTGLKILYSHLTTDGAIFRPTGGTATGAFAQLPTFALVVRPISTGEKHLYAPNWALAPETVHLLRHSELGSQLSSAALVLIPCRPTSASSGVPSWEWAASATIDSVFSLGIVP